VKFAGIAASPGIGVGPVLRYESEEVAVRDTRVPPQGAARELEHFQAALEASRRDLTRIRDGIAAELGAHEAQVYDAHLLILDDPGLIAAVERGVREEGRNAAWIVRAHLSAVAAHLESLADEYLRERRADIVDVERRVLRHLLGDGPRAGLTLDRPSILVAHDLAPSEAALLDRERVLGFVTEVGSRSSHCAIVARGRGIPAVVSARGVMQRVKAGDTGAVDGFAGEFELNPDEERKAFFVARRDAVVEEEHALDAIHDQPAVTLDGRRIELGANLEQPQDTDRVLAVGADGVGLFRTEFFYLGRPELPSEEEQYRAYRKVAERLAPRPVIFRTMDLGGDKVASYLGMTHETNPFLGWRGIRFALHHPELFSAQLRAIYRASAHGTVRLMFPMISSLDELQRANQLCGAVAAGLERDGIAYDRGIETGIMIETPSAVWMADVLAKHARFLSIGTNDLTQYTLAMDRDNERLAHLYEPLDPALLRSIRHTVEAGHAAGRWVGVCGEMAGDPANAVLLLGMGVDELSMACFDLPRVKAAIRSVRADAAEAIAVRALEQSGAAGVREVLRETVDSLLPSFMVEKKVGA
jgi:phosphotransferase system enzyme I (PtsI)